MSLLSWNSFRQPPSMRFIAAILLRVSPLTTVYSPSPRTNPSPIALPTVSVFWLTTGRSAEREVCSPVERGPVPCPG